MLRVALNKAKEFGLVVFEEFKVATGLSISLLIATLQRYRHPEGMPEVSQGQAKRGPWNAGERAVAS